MVTGTDPHTPHLHFTLFIVTLDLTINNVVTGTDVQTACNSFTWIDGITYNASTNTPTFTIVGGSVSGCDSIVTLDLTINNVVTAPMSTACNILFFRRPRHLRL